MEKEFYDRNKMIKCDCGGKYSLKNKCYHFKSKKHLYYEEHNKVYVAKTSKFNKCLDELSEEDRILKQDYYKKYWLEKVKPNKRKQNEVM